MASGNHFMPLPQIFFKEPFIQVDGNAFFSPKENVFLVIKSFLSASGSHYLRYKEAYLKLLLQPFYFIFPIFLSVGTDFLFSRNSILLFTGSFRDFCKTTLVLLVEANLKEIYLKRILYYGQQQQIFCLAETIFLHSYFFEPIIAIRGRPIYEKKLYLVVEPFSSIFFRH